MQNYELTIVLTGGTTAAKKKAADTKLKKTVKSLKGKIGKLDDWGELKLAYNIAGKDTGVFLHYPLELDSQAVKTLVDKLKLEEEIVRYLLVRREK